MLSVVCPATASVPCDVNDDVAVITPPVVVPTTRLEIVAFVAIRFVKNEETADRTVEKKLVDVPLVAVKLFAKSPVAVAEVITAEEAEREETCAFVLCSEEIVPEDTERSDIDVVASLELPDTVRFETVAVASAVVPVA